MNYFYLFDTFLSQYITTFSSCKLKGIVITICLTIYTKGKEMDMQFIQERILANPRSVSINDLGGSLSR